MFTSFYWLFENLANGRITPVVVGICIVALALLIAVTRIPISYSLLNLVARRWTTALTALAFTLVTGLLVAMMALVNGMYAITRSSGQPGNVIILAEGATDESFSNLGFSDIGDIENQPGINRDEGRPLVSRETYLIVNQPLAPQPKQYLLGLFPLADPPKRRFLQLRGVDDPLISSRVHAVELHAGGRWFSEAGVRESNDPSSGGRSFVEVVLGEGIARQMARDQQLDRASKPRLDAGDTFELNERTWIVTGVMKSEGLTFDSELWAKRSLIGPWFGKETYSSLVARTADAEAALVVKNYFNSDYKKAAVNVQTETEYYASLSETNTQFLIAILFLTTVMAIGGTFGVMNTMYAAISQRTRDIGVMRLLGFDRWQILNSFLLESLTIAVLGGLIGCLLGWLVDGYRFNSIVSSGQSGKFVVLRLVVDANTLAIGMISALLMGFFGGLLPSLRAIQLKTLDALR